jgi:hypothetical protein
MKKRVGRIKIIIFERDYLGQSLFVLVGLVMAAGTLLKLLHVINISSDWFWFIAGLGLTVEGIIALVKQKRFNNKYKVLSKEEFEKLTENKG